MPTASQLSLPNLKHLNNGLFSDYYLNDIVPTTPEAFAPQVYADAKKLRDELRALLEQIQPESLDEAQLEERWVKPVLRRLGYHWSVQVKIRYRDRGFRKPDYVFTASETEANALTNAIYAPQDLRGGIAVGDAKRWGANLDQTSGEGRNPSQQIDEYLRYSELPWGILTDGRVWRLYHRDNSKDNLYYAVDLRALLLASDDDHAAVTNFLLYFYLFFRVEAFAKDGWLARVLQGSTDYAASLSDTLEDEVYEALELIAQGFLNFRRNRLTTDALTLRTIYEQSLVLLYRLLFILYAESRDVLPMTTNKAYADERSLRAISAQVRDLLEKETALSRRVDQDSLYRSLSALFFAIDSGSPEYDVTPYNGRLFSEAEYLFLAEKSVGDAYLARALDKLARIDSRVRNEKTPRRVFVDYRDLDVRHLGAIYEKLLEYQLDVATEPMTIRGSRYAPAQTGDKIAKDKGDVYLRTGNFERKITGSFYTPDYIVRFIVERTLEPLLTEITEQYATLDDEEHWQVRDAAVLRRALLSVNVLDPATGSGHFMVEAVAYIAEWLRKLALQPEDLTPDEDELVYWKRQVVTSCIYGVDINPLAVELAKLSLWLATLARGKPLSFLDHHVKLGNTLVGARMNEISATLAAPANLEQPPLFAEALFNQALGDGVQRIMRIETTVAGDVQDVKGQEQSYATYKDKTEPLRALANVWTARHFGLEVTPEAWAALYAQATRAEGMDGEAERVQAADKLRKDFCFFHWELEFPEVFFGEDGKPLADGGFDAVIGNPPYVRQERLQPYKPYFQAQYRVYQGTADLYVYFYERALDLLRAGGQASYITANKWLRAGYGEPMRGLLAQQAETREIVDFGHAPIFHDADTFPAILVLRKPHGERAPDARAQITQFPRESLGIYTLSEYAARNGYPVPLTRFSSASWSLENPDVEALMDKIRSAGDILREYADSKPNIGVLTAYNDAYLIDDATRERLVDADKNCAPIIKAYLRGQDIKRWSPDWDGLWMIVLKSSDNHSWPWSHAGENAELVFAQTYPSLYEHFKTHESALRKRHDKGRYWWELRSCAYYEDFEKPKVIYQEIQFHPAYSFDTSGYFMNNKGIMLLSDDLFLLAALNSPLMWWHNWRHLPHMKDEALNPAGIKMVDIPIARPTDAQRAAAEGAVKRLIALTRERRARVRDLLGWLHTEFEIDKPGQRLEDFAGLAADGFIDEVKKRRPRSAARLSPAALHDLGTTHAEYAGHVQILDSESDILEHKLSDLVNAAYGLTSADIDLMWRTAPPRMPIKPPGQPQSS